MLSEDDDSDAPLRIVPVCHRLILRAYLDFTSSSQDGNDQKGKKKAVTGEKSKVSTIFMGFSIQLSVSRRWFRLNPFEAAKT